MALPIHPKTLVEIPQFWLSNYRMDFVFYPERNVPVSGFYPIRTKADHAVLYCLHQDKLRSLLNSFKLSGFLIRSKRFLICTLPEDPHGFSLDEIPLGFQTSRAHVFSDIELQTILEAGSGSLSLPSKPLMTRKRRSR